MAPAPTATKVFAEYHASQLQAGPRTPLPLQGGDGWGKFGLISIKERVSDGGLLVLRRIGLGPNYGTVVANNAIAN